MGFCCDEKSLFSHRREFRTKPSRTFDSSRRGACRDFSPPREIFSIAWIVSCVHVRVSVASAPLFPRSGATRDERMDGWRAQAEGGRMRVMGARSHKTATTDTGSCSPSVPYSPRSRSLFSPAFLARLNLALPPPLAFAIPRLSRCPQAARTKIRSFCVRSLSRFSLDPRSIVTEISYERSRCNVLLQVFIERWKHFFSISFAIYIFRQT